MEQKHSFNLNFNISLTELPKCKCGEGSLLPLSDDSREGYSFLKGWVCSHCEKVIYIKTGMVLSTTVQSQELPSR